MGDHDNELFEALKERPDKEPDKAFSNQMRQQLQKLQKGQIVKRKRVSIATILTIPVTMAVLAFLLMICTGQTLEIKSAAQLSITQEKNLIFTGSLCILIALLTFIIFVFRKGYTKGWLIFLMFALSFLAWVMNTVYAETQHIEEPTVLSTYSESFDHDYHQSLVLSVTKKESKETRQSVTIGPFTMLQEHRSLGITEEIQQEFHSMKTTIFHVERGIVKNMKEHEEVLAGVTHDADNFRNEGDTEQ